jgi:hypothetical protein
MSILGRIFGSEKVLDAAIGGVTKGLDALVYTDEEKANDAAKERAAARSMVVEWTKNSQGQNIARRLIAIVITGVWLLMYLASTGLEIASIWVDPELRGAIVESSLAIAKRADSMTGAMMLILAFYFAAPHMGKIVEGAMGKFSGENNGRPRN